MQLPSSDPVAMHLVAALRAGDVESVQRQLALDPALATARIVDPAGVARTLLHVVADWPGHAPRGAQSVAVLVAAGAEVNARVEHGTAPETALHWAASCDDVPVLDALLDAGADIDASGAVFTGGAPLSDAVIFAQWAAAHRLVERGAQVTLWQAAALGLIDRVKQQLAAAPTPDADAITNALWHACRGGQLATTRLLVERGGDLGWVGHEGKNPRDVARTSGSDELLRWLEGTEHE